MTTLQEQLAHETKMMDLGSIRFEKATDLAEEKGRVHETSYGSTLMKAAITPVAEGLTAFCEDTKPGRNARIRPLLQSSDPEKVAFLALQVVFGCFTKDDTTLSEASGKIGQRVEDELKFQKFSELFPGYYDKLVEDFKRRGTTNYRHLHRVFTQMSSKKGMAWQTWTAQEKIEVGAATLNIILERTDMVERVMTRRKNKTIYNLTPTKEALDWISRHKDHMALMSPDFLPTLIEPVPWTEVDQGGFYSPQVRAQCGFIKGRKLSPDHKHLLRTATMPDVYKAVNTIQEVPWQINRDVHDVMRSVWASGNQVGMPRSEPYEIPPAPLGKDVDLKSLDVDSKEYRDFMLWKSAAAELYSMEKERRAKCFSITRIMRMANDFADKSRFWFVHNLDFRGGCTQ
jgi:DNA-directed RNA polymerase